MSETYTQLSKNLVAVDGSELSMKAADYAIAIAKREDDNAEIIALHVIHSEIKYLYSTLIASSIRETVIETAKQTAQKWLSKVIQKAR